MCLSSTKDRLCWLLVLVLKRQRVLVIYVIVKLCKGPVYCFTGLGDVLICVYRINEPRTESAEVVICKHKCLGSRCSRGHTRCVEKGVLSHLRCVKIDALGHPRCMQNNVLGQPACMEKKQDVWKKMPWVIQSV